jgi:hypothetical protein
MRIRIRTLNTDSFIFQPLMEASDAFTRRVLARCTELATQTRGDTHIRLSDIRQVSHIQQLSALDHRVLTLSYEGR